MAQVTVLYLFLPPLPAGIYSLSLHDALPIFTGRSFDSTTSGANCVGTPCGNNMNAFFNSNFFGANFTSTDDEGQPTDFSMGVNGTAGCGTPTTTPTPTGTPTCTPAALWYNGD